MNKEDHTQEEVKDVKEEVRDVKEEVKEVEQEIQNPSELEAEKEASITEEMIKQEKDRYLRLFAEFENYKKRTSRERIELFKTASQELMTSLLPIMDDFDRGLNEIEKTKDKEVLKGMKLIKDKLKTTLIQKGLSEIEVKEGDDFEAEIHEAVTQIPAPTEALKGKVIDLVEKGYKLGDKIIRYPKVVTGR